MELSIGGIGFPYCAGIHAHRSGAEGKIGGVVYDAMPGRIHSIAGGGAQRFGVWSGETQEACRGIAQIATVEVRLHDPGLAVLHAQQVADLVGHDVP
jgi:hypothetical protein